MGSVPDEFAPIDAVLRRCRATAYLAGRVKTIPFLDHEGAPTTGFDAGEVSAVLRELVAVVDTSPAGIITPEAQALADRVRPGLEGITAFAEHGADALGQGRA